MKFDNAVTIPLPVDEAWKVLLDVPRIAPCLPGAELTEIEGDNSFKGKVAVRLGPVALMFAGRARIGDIDQDAHRARITAQGVDAKGRGAANSVIDFELQPNASGCAILVHTDLTLSGSVAQYGRGSGLIREVAAQLMDQFADALKAKLTAEGVLGTRVVGNTEPALPASAAVQPISGLSLFIRSLWNLVRRQFTGGAQAHSE